MEMRQNTSIFVSIIAGLRHSRFKTYCRLKWRIGVCKQLHAVSTNTLFEAFFFMVNYKDCEGRKFGKLTIIKVLPSIPKKKRRCIIVCECGTQKELQMQNIVNGTSKSCGCLKREASASDRLLALNFARQYS